VNRAEKRRRTKADKKRKKHLSKKTKASSSNESQKPNPGDAIKAFQQGVACHQQGRMDEAMVYYKKSIEEQPHNAFAYSNIGMILRSQGKIEKALVSYQKAILINPDYVEAHNNIGNLLKEQNKLKEAIISYQKAISINPNFIEGYHNLGKALVDQGRIEEAVQILQGALEKDPENKEIIGNLILTLNYFKINDKPRGPYVLAQKAMQMISVKNLGAYKISDETVQEIFQQCSDVLTVHNMTDTPYISTQIWKGNGHYKDCKRHFFIFDKFNIIPKYCFSCYKVLIAPRTVIELFKLMFVFDTLKLPDDNTKKCMVEVRPGISGKYKGLIYCRNLDEAKEILTTVKSIVTNKISKKIVCSIQRGCSEFKIAYPEFAIKEGKKESLFMPYNEEWREHEEHADKNLIGHIRPSYLNEHNHIGFTLHDVFVMRTWLAYASAKGDYSYQKITNLPIRQISF